MNPFALVVGVVSLSMLLMHGAAWLTLKADGVVQVRARAIGSVATLMAVSGYILLGLWLAFGIDGYQIVGRYVTDGPSNPLYFEVAKGGNWLAAYAVRPWIVIAPVLGIAGGLMAFLGPRAGREVSTLLFSKLAIFGMISSVGLTMFRFILPSSTDPKSSLPVCIASSSKLTLFIIQVCTVIFLPLILMYTAWIYKVLWGKVTAVDVTGNSQSLY